MKLFRQPAAQNLSEWLETATGELVPSAQARVSAEIETHFAEAVQRHREQGLADSSALVAALTDLGDAHAAAARFRREHLTKLEVNTVLSQAQYACDTSGCVPWSDLFFLLLLFVLSLGWLYDWAYRPIADGRPVFFATVFLLLIIGYAALSIAVDVLARRKPSLATTRRIFCLGFIKSFTRSLTERLLILMFMIDFLLITFSKNDPLYVKFFQALFGGWIIFWGLRAFIFHTKQTRFNLRLHKKLASANPDDFPGLSRDAA